MPGNGVERQAQPMLRRFASALTTCQAESAAYEGCIKAALPDVCASALFALRTEHGAASTTRNQDAVMGWVGVEQHEQQHMTSLLSCCR